MESGHGGAVFVGIDAGTTGATVVLFDERGNEVSRGYREYPCLHPHPGWVEQDMDEVWKGICSASRQAIAEAPAGARARIRSVGLASQRGTFALLDRREHPLGPAIVWNDSRAKAMEDELAGAIDRKRYRSITGVPLSAHFSVARLAWLRRNRPELLDRTRWVVNGQEYFLRRLGADRLETDPASLTLNGMLDIAKLDWSEEVCRAAGVDPRQLPPVGAPGQRVGSLSDAAAEATGMPPGIAVCRGGGDQQCAALGAGVTAQGQAEVTIGTAAMMVAHLDDPSLVKGSAAYLGGHAVPGRWDLEGGAYAIGSALRWFRDTLGQVETEAAGQLGISAYDLITAQAAAAPAGARGLIFHPFFTGQVTPNYDASARAGFLGLGLHHDRTCIARALLEGCAFEIRLMVDSVAADLEGGIQDLRLTGGGARSAVFNRIHADVQNRPISLLHTSECTALGAAMLGAVGSKWFSNVEEAVAVMVQVRETLTPAGEHRALYDDLFAAFNDAYQSLAGAGWYSRLYGLQDRYF